MSGGEEGGQDKEEGKSVVHVGGGMVVDAWVFRGSCSWSVRMKEIGV